MDSRVSVYLHRKQILPVGGHEPAMRAPEQNMVRTPKQSTYVVQLKESKRRQGVIWFSTFAVVTVGLSCWRLGEFARVLGVVDVVAKSNTPYT